MPGPKSNFGKVNPDAVKLMCERGFTDDEIRQCLHVSDRTWDRWKKKNTEFYNEVRDWKIRADRNVEKSLYERAKGYTCPETKPQWVQDDNGGRWEYADLEKHYPPDPTSMIFWLKNRQPEKWRDKQEINNSHSGEIVFKWQK